GVLLGLRRELLRRLGDVARHLARRRLPLPLTTATRPARAAGLRPARLDRGRSGPVELWHASPPLGKGWGLTHTLPQRCNLCAGNGPAPGRAPTGTAVWHLHRYPVDSGGQPRPPAPRPGRHLEASP